MTLWVLLMQNCKYLYYKMFLSWPRQSSWCPFDQSLFMTWWQSHWQAYRNIGLLVHWQDCTDPLWVASLATSWIPKQLWVLAFKWSESSDTSGTVTGTPTTLSTAGIRLWHIGWWEGHSRSLSGWKQLLMEQSQPARAGPITPTPAAALTAFQQGMCMVPLSSVIGAIVQKHCSIRI